MRFAMTNTYRHPSILRGLAAFALVSLSGCLGQESDAAISLPNAQELNETIRLDVRIDGAEWPEDQDEVRTGVPPTVEGHLAWTAIDGGTLSEAPMGAGLRGVKVVPTGGTVLLNMPLPKDGAGKSQRGMDLVRITAIVPRFARIAVIAGRGEAWETFSSVVEVAHKNRPTTIELPFISSGASGHDLDSLTVFIQGAEAPLGFLDAEIVKLPNAARLPHPGARIASHVALGSESRPGRGLLPGSALLCQLPPATGGSIEFGLGLPPSVAPDGNEEVIASIVRGGKTVIERSFNAGTGWSDCSLPASAIDGREGAHLRLSTSHPEGVIVSTPLVAPAPRENAQTVLLVTSDTHRADYVGFASLDPRVQTPVMNELAARGLTFHQARSVSSITNPSHTSILTGLSPRDTGVQGNLTLLSDRATTIAEAFQDAGYRTFAAVSARHLSPGRSGLGQGFERFDAPAFYLARDGKKAVSAASDMLATASGQNTFLWVHFFDVHGPYRDHEQYTQLYYDRAKSDPFSEKFAELPPEMRLPWETRVRDAKFALALYSGEVTYVDRLLGSLFERNPRLEDGLIALTADHGESHGEQQLWWTHNGMYPSTLNVPLVIAGPGIRAGECSAAVSNTFVAGTLLELAGIDRAREFPGERLHRISDEPTESSHREPHFVVGPDGNSAGLFEDGWYFLLHVTGKGWGNPRHPARHAAELYCLEDDPGCETNVIRAHPERAAIMRYRVVEFLNDLPEEGVLASDELIGGSAKADMVALGYAAESAGKIDRALVDPACSCVFCAEAAKHLAR